MEMSSLDGTPVLVSMSDRSAVGEVRRAAAAVAGRLGFSKDDSGRLALVITEAANNMVKHGGEAGQVLVRPVPYSNPPAVEALFLDHGSGIADLPAALRDGFSTAGSPGTGLGALSRVADVFDIYSEQGRGAVLFTRVWPRGLAAETREKAALEIGAVGVPRRDEACSGDGWAIGRAKHGLMLLVVDGLGHGPEAAHAAAEAIQMFGQEQYDGPAEFLAAAHGALRNTRGAAAAAALLDTGSRQIRYAGVGNIAATVVSGLETRSLVSHNGTLGHETRRIQEFVYPWPQGALVVMHSDGLQTHWRLDRYAGALARHPGVIAGLLYRDFSRGRDDVTVLAVRESIRPAAPGDVIVDE
jgi:anti-sigma regulatory factor (Ser/Thr protein kinase)